MINDAINNQIEMWDRLIRRDEASGFLENMYRELLGNDDHVSIPIMRQGIELGLRGSCYSVTEPIVNLLRAAASSLPLEWTLRETDLPTPAGFVWFDRSIRFVETDGSEAEWCGIMWHGAVREGSQERGLVGYVLERMQRRGLAIVPFAASGIWPYGTPISGCARAFDPLVEENPAEHEYYFSAIRLMAAFWIFVQQDIVTLRRERPGRALRKRAAALSMESDVKVITLRRTVARDDGRPHPGGEAEEIEWSCQWIVRGHWRKQWYPKTQEHRAIWISPYVKGPEDRPLRVPTAQIFDVSR